MTNYEKVKEFHDKYRISRGWNHPTFITDKEALTRLRLMQEELAEVAKAMSNKDMLNLAKELADLLYVVYGTADSYGIPIDKVFNEVHKSNMTKSTERDSGGKIQKGDNYIEPNIEGALR